MNKLSIKNYLIAIVKVLDGFLLVDSQENMSIAKGDKELIKKIIIALDLDVKIME